MGKLVNFDKESGSFELAYGGLECSFIGLDSSGPPNAINPGAITQNSYNFLRLNNALCPIDFSTGVLFTPTSTQTFLGVGDLDGVMFYVYYDSSDTTLYVVADSTPTAQTPTWSITASISLPWVALASPPIAGSLTFKNVNGICYFSFSYCPYILSYQVGTLAILTNQLGCAYLNELNGRLVAANVFQVSQAQPASTLASTPATETFTNVANPIFGVNTQTGSNMAVSAYSVPAGASVGLTVNFSWSIVSHFPGGDNPNSYIGTVTIQYSINSGTSWETLYSYQVINATQSQNNQSAFIDLSSVMSGGNTDTIAVRLVVSSAGADLPNIIFVSATINSVAVAVNPTPIPAVYSEYPFQFAWSAAEEQYSIWTALGANGLVTGAGYNNLPDVEDIITGLIMEGPTGYIIRQQGITEVTPLSNGTDPFDFNHLWASHQGIGSKFPYAATQYGALGYIPANDDIYTIGYAGINVITGIAKSAIYGTVINSFTGVIAGAGYLSIDGEASSVFFICTVAGPNSPGFLYWQATNTWYKILLPENLQPLQVNSINYLIQTNRSQYVNGFAVTCLNTATEAIEIVYFNLSSGLSNGAEAYAEFPLEEVAIGRDLTIDAILLYVYIGTGVDSFVEAQFQLANPNYYVNNSSVNITNNIQEFTTFLSNEANLVGAQYQYIVLTPTAGVALTMKGMQLQVLLISANEPTNSMFSIGKIHIFGSVDMAQRPI